MHRYVLGFLFDGSQDSVLLTLKTHPDWQAGHWNGIGGQADGGESFRKAMWRECSEELGFSFMWEPFATITGPDWKMRCFTAREPRPDVSQFNTPRENDKGETLRWCQIKNLPGILPDLRWLIPMAMEMSRPKWPLRIRVDR
jgi:8-oxo-dGTP pyrophosphatase MutT (NUDIX family)